MQRITIDPITRLEGHGKIEIFLDEQGDVERTYFQVPELRGFEQFCVGRPVEEMPVLVNRICGVCPEAHHMAAAMWCASGHTPQMRLVSTAISSTGRPTQNCSKPRSSGI